MKTIDIYYERTRKEKFMVGVEVEKEVGEEERSKTRQNGRFARVFEGFRKFDFKPFLNVYFIGERISHKKSSLG